MRIKVIFIIIFLLTMAFLPVFISKCTSLQTAVASVSTADTVTKPSNTENTATNEPTTSDANNNQQKNMLSETELCGLVAADYDENYCKETLKALAVILYTNYNAAPEKYDLSDNEICLTENEAENSVKENYNEIKSAVSSVYKKVLCKDNKALYIPFCKSTDGKTTPNSEYPYLTAIASPWDCYTNYSEGEHYGVSLNGINFLCNEGYSYEKALQWYLPDFTVQTHI